MPHVAVPMWEVASDALRRFMEDEMSQRETSIDALRARLRILLSYDSIRLAVG